MSDQHLPADHVDVLLRAAVAAPSMHNTQPWRFEVDGHVIDLFLDGSRTLPAEDPTGRAMRIAAGAATFNLRCAAASLGYGTWLGFSPYPGEPDLLARIVIRPTSTPDDELAGLAAQIPRRHTDRRPSDSTPLAEQTRVKLMLSAYAEGAELTWLGEPEVHTVLGLVLDSDLREIGEWQRRAERAHWVGGERDTEGIPSSALGPRSTTYPGAVREMATRPVDHIRAQSAFEAHPDLAVLSTERDEPTDQVGAGAALERMLLTATREGVSASFLNQLLEFEDLRRRVQDLTLRPGHAHMVIRFGHSRPGTATTARRPIADFLPTEEQS